MQRNIIFLIAALAPQLRAAGQDGCLPGFATSPFFAEQVRELRPDEDVRLVLNAPAAAAWRADHPTRVIIYATPNGSTIEHTLGCRKAPGLDWRYDIQHIAAQVRLLRQIDRDENLVLACLQARGRSWPAWRASHREAGRRIRAIVAAALAALPGRPARLVLAAHSGGGSFLWGYLEGGARIPAQVERIVFLDANYSFSVQHHHGELLLAWLRRSQRNRLVVLAYDDREVLYRGKPIVGPEGGTYRACERMIAAFSRAVRFVHKRESRCELDLALKGRLRIQRLGNPAKRILHSALVGDMNGLVSALALGTSGERKWGRLGGPRVYERWIQPIPGTGLEERAPAEQPRPLPPRPGGARGGAAVLRSVANLPLAQREERILAELESGNLPAFLRRPVVVEVRARCADGALHTARYRVSPDYLAVGSESDFARVPLTPMAAQRFADRFGFTFPTRRMVDQIYARAALKLSPRPLTDRRQAVATFLEHNALIEGQRAGARLGALVAGIKKDLVITPRLADHAGRVAIYGWHRPTAKPIQPLYLGHIATYVDYSHGVRLVWREMEVDGRSTRVAAILADAVLHPLLSDEGPVPPACQRYRLSHQ